MENRCVAVYLLWHPLGHWNPPCKHSAPAMESAGKAGWREAARLNSHSAPQTRSSFAVSSKFPVCTSPACDTAAPFSQINLSPSSPSPKEQRVWCGSGWCWRETDLSVAVRGGTVYDCVLAHRSLVDLRERRPKVRFLLAHLLLACFARQMPSCGYNQSKTSIRELWWHCSTQNTRKDV